MTRPAHARTGQRASAGSARDTDTDTDAAAAETDAAAGSGRWWLLVVGQWVWFAVGVAILLCCAFMVKDMPDWNDRDCPGFD